MSAPPADPLILTATFDPAAAAIFQRMRDRHFPPRLNIVPAHLTLFHKLPGVEHAAIDAFLLSVSAAERPVGFDVKGPRFLGRGVALDIEAAPLLMLRRRLADHWDTWLMPQDSQPFRPHVTIQNKTDPVDARALYDQLVNDPPRLERLSLGWNHPSDTKSLFFQRAGAYSHQKGLSTFLEYAVSGFITGLDLWHYRGGPWERAGCYVFKP